MDPRPSSVPPLAAPLADGTGVGRGFQRLSLDARRAVSSLGGKRRQALQAAGHGRSSRFHEGDERAREAGRRSGATRARKRAARLLACTSACTSEVEP